MTTRPETDRVLGITGAIRWHGLAAIARCTNQADRWLGARGIHYYSPARRIARRINLYALDRIEHHFPLV